MDQSKEERIIELKNLISRSRQKYYNDAPGQPISDAAYDALEAELKQLAPYDLFWQEVGAPVVNREGRRKVQHKRLIGSLNDAMTDEKFTSWYNGLDRPAVVCTPKIDGLTLELTYEQGKLVQAATRGDGSVGEDVTAAALRIQNLPRFLNGGAWCQVRGECYLETSELEKINAPLPEEKKYANPRNAASGIMNRLDGCGAERLKFYAFDLLETGPHSYDTYMGILTRLDYFGFDPIPRQLVPANQLNEIIRIHNDYAKSRDHLAYWIDGVVVKINSLSKQRETMED